MEKLCRSIESAPANFVELMRAHLADSPEDLGRIVDNIEAGEYDRICGQPVVPGTESCERHTDW